MLYNMIIIAIILISFLCGSIPSGYLIGKKLYGVDIRTMGSGNIGSTNVKRVLGTKASLITQVMDVLKGVIPVLVAIYLVNKIELPIEKDIFLSIIALVVILGHNYTPFLRFKGGKGVNTTLGAFVFLVPIPTFLGVFVHFALKLLTKIVSIRSIATGVTIPIACILMQSSSAVLVATTVAAILMIIRHKDNLVRLINKEEK